MAASDQFRSDPQRAAELAVVLADYLRSKGRHTPAHRIAAAVVAMQKAGRSAKRMAEHARNYGYRDEAHEARVMQRQDRKQAALCAMLADLTGDAVEPCHVELGGDPRGPCARLHIPGQRGDGWGDGFGIY